MFVADSNIIKNNDGITNSTKFNNFIFENYNNIYKQCLYVITNSLTNSTNE